MPLHVRTRDTLKCGGTANPNNCSFAGFTPQHLMIISVSWEQSSVLNDERKPGIDRNRFSQQNMGFRMLSIVDASQRTLSSICFGQICFSVPSRCHGWLGIWKSWTTIELYKCHQLDLELCSIEGCQSYVHVTRVVGAKLPLALTELLSVHLL